MNGFFMFYIYILYSESSDKFYVGHSNDPLTRPTQRNSNLFNTYTSKHRPWVLKANFECGLDEKEAIRIEHFIKQQKSRELVIKLIDPNFVPTGFLAQLVRVPHVRD